MMMLFFRKLYRIRNIPRLLKHKKYHENFAPLQVQYSIGKTGKRALSWTSLKPGNGVSVAASFPGSLSLEAALSLPLFLFLCFCLIMPMRMMDRQRQIQAALEAAGEDISKYAYAVYCIENWDWGMVDAKKEGMADMTEGQGTFSAAASAYGIAKAMSQINQEWVEDVSFAETEIGTDEMVRIVMRYKMRLPFSVFGIESIPMEAVCSRRMWTGAEGNRKKNSETEEKKEDETIVYIGKSSTRYHTDRTCHYLYNNLQQLLHEDIEKTRNKEGKRYAPCKSCGNVKGQDKVYVMPYGTSYHTSSACSAIISYVQTVPIGQVEYLGACSYCGGEGG